MKENFYQLSYCVHEQNIVNKINEKEERFFLHQNKDCVEYKVNIRTLELLKSLLKFPNTWLTVGDYNGFEAMYFKEHRQDVTASDISDAFLREAKEQHFIDKYRKENAEQLSLSDGSVDYVSCREALHHFPRPYLALYEMLRVSKKGIIIIEPIDILAKMPVLLFIKNFLDIFNPYLINKLWKNRFSWEIVGNYVFKISEREIEKLAMAMGLPCIALRGINVLLHIKENMRTVPTDVKLLRKINRKFQFLNFLCRLHLIPYNTLCAIIFKTMPDEETIAGLKKEGFVILKLPQNPYLSK